MDNHNTPVPDEEAPAIGLDLEQMERVMLHLVSKFDRSFTEEELFAQCNIIDEWYRQYVLDTACWRLWHEGKVEFSIADDGGIKIEYVE